MNLIQNKIMIFKIQNKIMIFKIQNRIIMKIQNNWKIKRSNKYKIQKTQNQLNFQGNQVCRNKELSNQKKLKFKEFDLNNYYTLFFIFCISFNKLINI